MGADPEVVLRDLLELTHLLTRLQVAPEAGADPSLSETERQRAEALAGGLSMPVLARTWQMLLKGLGEVRGAPSALAAAEMILIRLAYAADLPSPAEAVKQLTDATPPGDGAAVKTAAAQTSAPDPVAQANFGAAASAAPQRMPQQIEQPMAAEPARQATHPTIDSFAALVALAQDRDVRLYHHLMEDVRLVEFRPGHLEIRPEDNAPPDLASNLRRKLESWSGTSWAVVIDGQAEGQTPLAAQQRQTEADILAAAAADPLVQAVLETFPGAAVTDVRPLPEGSVDGDAAAEPTDPSYGADER